MDIDDFYMFVVRKGKLAPTDNIIKAENFYQRSFYLSLLHMVFLQSMHKSFTGTFSERLIESKSKHSQNNQLNKIQSIVLYLGNTCNFDCVYCDRGYIENLGGQNLTRSTSDEMREFIEWVERQPNEIKQLSFHGGEPLLFVIRMKEIMEWAYPILIRNGWKMSITTNGSLIKKNEDFLKNMQTFFM